MHLDNKWEKSNSCLNSDNRFVDSNYQYLYKADFILVGCDIHKAESVVCTLGPDVACKQTAQQAQQNKYARPRNTRPLTSRV